MEEIKETYSIEEYNNEPVFYCKNCLSLRVKIVGGFDFCEECGCTDIAQCHIDEWDKLYTARNGRKFLDEVEPDYYNFLK